MTSESSDHRSIARAVRAGLAGLWLALAASAAQAAECDFEQALQAGLIKESFADITAAIRRDPQAATTVANALPNFKRIFQSREGQYTLLVGWAELDQDYSTLSRAQIGELLTVTAEKAKGAAESAGQSYRYRIEPGTNPVSTHVTLEYQDGGRAFRDVGLDVIATARCVFSAKFSGVVSPGDDQTWGRFEAELARLKGAAAAYGPVIYLEDLAGGEGFGWLWIIALLVALAAAGGLYVVFVHKPVLVTEPVDEAQETPVADKSPSAPAAETRPPSAPAADQARTGVEAKEAAPGPAPDITRN